MVIFDHRGHGASDNPTDPAAYSFDRLVADTLAVADATGLDHFRLLGHSMGGMVARRIAINETSRVDALVMMDTSAGPIPGFDPTLIDIACDVALTQGKQALKELMDLASALETPAYKRVLAARPGYPEFEARKWADVSRSVGDVGARVGNQSDDLPAMTSLRVSGARHRRRTGRAVRDRVPRWPTRSRVPSSSPFRTPGHSPQFENPEAWIAALTGFLSALPAAAR